MIDLSHVLLVLKTRQRHSGTCLNHGWRRANRKRVANCTPLHVTSPTNGALKCREVYHNNNIFYGNFSVDAFDNGYTDNLPHNTPELRIRQLRVAAKRDVRRAN